MAVDREEDISCGVLWLIANGPRVPTPPFPAPAPAGPPIVAVVDVPATVGATAAVTVLLLGVDRAMVDSFVGCTGALARKV